MVDVWFSQSAPRGHEANWVRAVPGKGWKVVMRLYGPEEAWLNENRRPGEIEAVEQALVHSIMNTRAAFFTEVATDCIEQVPDKSCRRIS